MRQRSPPVYQKPWFNFRKRVLVVDGHQAEGAAGAEQSLAVQMLAVDGDLDDQRGPAGVDDLGDDLDHRANMNRLPEVDALQRGGHHRPLTEAHGGDGGRLVHPLQQRTAKEAAVVVGVARQHHVDRARFGRETGFSRCHRHPPEPAAASDTSLSVPAIERIKEGAHEPAQSLPAAAGG
jgi:hypothetical protein